MKTIIAIFFLTIAASVRADTITINILTTRNNGTVTTNTIAVSDRKTDKLQAAVGNVRLWLAGQINSAVKSYDSDQLRAAYEADEQARREALRTQLIAIESSAEE